MSNSTRVSSTTRIHIMALDGIVNVNSLFTLALFLGLTTTDPKSSTLIGGNKACTGGKNLAENLVASHVYSFSSFLFSSLVAFALQQAIRITNGGDVMLGFAMVHVNTMTLRLGILVSAVGSALGCWFLTMALIDFVQIKLGILACMSWYTFACVGPLVVLVPSALLIYLFLVLYAFTQ